VKTICTPLGEKAATRGVTSWARGQILTGQPQNLSPTVCQLIHECIASRTYGLQLPGAPMLQCLGGFWLGSKLFAFMVAIESMSELRLNYAIGRGAESQ